MAVPHGFGVAFTADALDPTPSYTLINTLAGISVQTLKIDRGRSTELDKTQTGTASADLIDRTGALDPTNPGGTYYGQIDPNKPTQIGLLNPVTSTWSAIFTGFTNEISYSLDLTENYLNSTWDCVDLFEVMAALEMSPGQHGQTPPDTSGVGDIYFEGEPTTFKHVDDRIKDALTDAGIPSAFWNIFSGNVSVQEKIYERRDQLLTVLQDAADAEFPGVANVFVSRTGVVTFHGRFARFFPDRPGYAINTWQAGDAAACADTSVAPVAPVDFHRSASDIINAAIALPLGVDDTDVPDQLSKDDTSIGTYGWRSVNGSFDSLLTYAGHDDDSNPTTAIVETKKFADYYANNYFEPRTRVNKLTFRPVGVGHPNATALWALMCGVELGDVVHLTTTHVGGGGFDEDFYVEGIHYDINTEGGANFTNVTLELDVSPRSYFDSNPFGEFDDT